MNREMRRMSQKIGRSMMKLPESKFEDVSVESRMRLSHLIGKLPDKVWKSNHFTVQLYRQERVLFGLTMDKLMIRRNDAEPITEWHCLQKIKDEIAGEESVAIQVFPKRSELVDVANMYWLFVESGKL